MKRVSQVPKMKMINRMKALKVNCKKSRIKNWCLTFFIVLTDESSEDDSEDVNNVTVNEEDEDSEDAAGEDDDDEEEEDEDDEHSEMGGPFKDDFMKHSPGMDSGCTAVVAILKGNDLYVANAGDSRCVVCKKG